MKECKLLSQHKETIRMLRICWAENVIYIYVTKEIELD